MKAVGFSILLRLAKRRMVAPGTGVITNAKAQRWDTQGRKYARWVLIYLSVMDSRLQKSKRQGKEIN